jgi:Sortase domain
MDEDGRCGPLGSIPRNAGAPTEPIPAIARQLDDLWNPALDDDLWDPALEDDWWGPTWDVLRPDGVAAAGEARTPAAGAANRGMRASRSDIGPDVSQRGVVRAAVSGQEGAVPKVSAPASAEPSWGRVLATTISLWVSRRRTRLVAASIFGTGLLAVGAGTAGLVVVGGSSAPSVRLPARPSPVAAPSVHTVTPVWLETMQRAARPVWLTVPVIGVRASIVDLGLNRNGTLQVPGSTTVVGWYTGSPRPGAIGSAVIAGHVDSRAGPGVFFWLRTMRPGERIYVKRADGTMAVFTVTGVRMYPKNKFPTAAVYGPVPDAELRLITCGGTFDESGGSYLSNVVVFARLTE